MLSASWLLMLTCVCQAGTPDVAKELRAYYQDSDKMPAYDAAIAKLASADPKERTEAGAWLRALLAQALKDEQSGVAPWRATPYWGSSGENPARNLRTTIARALAQAEPAPRGAVPVLRWYFEEEFLPAVQADAPTALNRLKTPEAAAARAELASTPHHNLAVVAEVLKQIAAEKERLSADKLLPLCQHHRASIREAARALHWQQGGADPGPFDPVQALRSPPVQKLLKDMGALLLDAPAPTAPFVVARYVLYDQNKNKKGGYDQVGWLLQEEGDKMEIFTPFGWRETVRRSTELTQDRERDNWWTCSLARGQIEAEVARVEKIRKDGNKEFAFSERGGLTGQFQGQGAGLYEIILAQRLHAAGKDALAARILFPALETLYRDDDAVQILRRDLGKNYGYQMLVAFAGDRDYARAEKLARTLAQHYPETIFHHYAVRLAEELPKRRDDFVKLKLPTPAVWAEMRKQLTREQQIAFLGQRYRLLNYFQAGQPGGYVSGSPQYAEPCGMDRNASWGLNKGKIEVINPESELAGVRWFGDDKQPRGLGLTLTDVPQLSKHLREDWLMPTVTFWRDFHPSRHLGSTRPLFAGIINGLARRDLCKIDGWDKLKPAEIDKEIERINRWALANARKTPIQLEWEVVDEELAARAAWRTVSGRVEWLLQQKEAKVYDVLERYLRDPKTDAYDLGQILRTYLQHDPARAKELAPRFLDHPERSVRFYAALLVFPNGPRVKAGEIFGEVLKKAELDSWSERAVDWLLKDSSPASRKQLVRLFANKELVRARDGDSSHGRPGVLRRCAAAGFVEPYRYYLQQLDNHAIAYTTWGGNDDKPMQVTYAEVHANEIVNAFAADDPTVKAIAGRHAKAGDRIPPLKKWLQSKLAPP